MKIKIKDGIIKNPRSFKESSMFSIKSISSDGYDIHIFNSDLLSSKSIKYEMSIINKQPANIPYFSIEPSNYISSYSNSDSNYKIKLVSSVDVYSYDIIRIKFPKYFGILETNNIKVNYKDTLRNSTRQLSVSVLERPLFLCKKQTKPRQLNENCVFSSSDIVNFDETNNERLLQSTQASSALLESYSFILEISNLPSYKSSTQNNKSFQLKDIIELEILGIINPFLIKRTENIELELLTNEKFLIAVYNTSDISTSLIMKTPHNVNNASISFYNHKQFLLQIDFYNMNIIKQYFNQTDKVFMNIYVPSEFIIDKKE